MSIPKKPVGVNPQEPVAEEKVFTLEDSMAADEEDKKREDAELQNERKKESKKSLGLLALLGLGLAGVVGTTVVVVHPFGILNNQPVGHDGTFSAKPTSGVSGDQNGTANGNKNPGSPQPTPEWWQDPKTQYPVKLEDWQKNDYLTQAATPEGKEKVDTAVGESTVGSDVYSSSNALPSEEAGYTSDITKMALPDGSLNPLYSAWTKERFNIEMQKAINRFINPYFGGWAAAEYSTWPRSNDASLPPRFADLFTEEYMLANKDKPVQNYLPLYADWGGNDYGMGDQLLQYGARWVGVIESSQLTFKPDDQGHYTADMVVKVKYVAWTKDQRKLEKHGTLTLHVVQPKSQTTHYFVFDQAKLTME